MELDFPPEENPLGFQTEVAIQLEYMKQFPVLDDTERIKEENVRKRTVQRVSWSFVRLVSWVLV